MDQQRTQHFLRRGWCDVWNAGGTRNFRQSGKNRRRKGYLMAESSRKKIAILGGGLGSLTAAYYLSLQDQYDITVYQLGWRLGGQGASGRNQKLNDRIEEHGLHVWFGYYENAFSLMRKCYDSLGRPKDAPLASVDEAFV